MKFFKLFSLLAVFLFAGTAFAAEGDTNLTNLVLSGDLTVGDDLSISDDMTVTDDVTITGDLTFNSSLLAEGRYGASTQLHSSSTVLGVSSLPFAVVRKNVGAGTTGKDTVDGGTRLLNGLQGQTLYFIINSLGGSSYWDLTPLTATGWSAARFDTKGDTLTITYINDTIGWVVVGNGGTTLTSVPFNGTTPIEP